MTKQEIIDYMYNNHVQGDFKIEEMAEDLAQPKIIRCKDCKHWDTTRQNHSAPNYHYCDWIGETRRKDFYCADAERKKE